MFKLGTYVIIFTVGYLVGTGAINVDSEMTRQGVATLWDGAVSLVNNLVTMMTSTTT